MLALTEDNWIKGTYARAEDGEPVTPESSRACKFCLMGWLEANRTGSREPVLKLADTIIKLYGSKQPGPEAVILNFNDDPATTWPMVERVLKESGLCSK